MVGTRLLVLLGLTALTLTPALADVATYDKTGQHSYQMQIWKQNTRNYVNILQNLMYTLEDDTAALNQSLRAAFEDVDRHIESIKGVVEQVLDYLMELKANITEEEEEPLVAFQAYISTSGSTPLAVNSISFKYGEVDLNVGNHYSSSTGLFTAPRTGLYWFYATFSCPGGRRESVMKVTKASNSQTFVAAYMKYYISQETAATTLVVMKAGDAIGVYPHTSTFEDWTLSTGDGNTFAGYFVADYKEPVGAETTTTTSTTQADTTTTTTTTSSATGNQ